MSEFSRFTKLVLSAVTLVLLGTGRVLAGSTPPSSALLLTQRASALVASGVLGTDADGDGADDTIPPIDCDDGDPNLCCIDVDSDGCDDCANGFIDDSNDGTDNDADGICDATDCDDSDSTVFATPTDPTSAASDRDNFCADDAGDIMLSATGGGGGGSSTTLHWFDDSCGGTDIGTGSPLTIASPTSTTTYYARWQNSCGDSNCASVTVTVNPLPADITDAVTDAVNDTICNGNSANLSATVGAGETVDWYSGSCGGTLEGSGSPLSVSPSSDTTYFARARNTTTNCVSANCDSITVFVDTTNPDCTITADLLTCAGTTGLSASVADAGVGATYDWTVTNGTRTDGGGNAVSSITYTAGATGSVTIDVTITEASGCSCSDSASVTIDDTAPDCTITADASVCADSTGNSASVSVAGGGATYDWTVTNGTRTDGGGNTTNSIEYTAGSTGTVTIDVTITEASGCTCSDSVNVSINTNPVCTITAATSVCADATGLSASVANAGGGATYDWTVTNGTRTDGGGNTTNTITYTAGSTGSVTIDVTITDANGCACSDSTNVTIDDTPPDCTITADASVCASATGKTASVPNAGGGATYDWTVTNGTRTDGGGNTTNSITYTAGASGSVTIDVTVTEASGCTCSDSASVTIDDVAPTCTLTADTLVCAGTTNLTASVPDNGPGATYDWTVTNGTRTDGGGNAASSITYTAGATGSVTIDVTVTKPSGCNCSDSASVTIDDTPPDCTITADASVCANAAGKTASVPNAGVGATYDWTVTNGTRTDGGGNTTNSITYTAGSTGSVTIDVTITETSGCTCSDSANVTIDDTPPDCTITADATVCADSTNNAVSVADAGGSATYDWTVTNGTRTDGGGNTTNSIEYTAGSTGTVTIDVTITEASGCTCSDSFNVTIQLPPTADAGAPQTICEGQTVTLAGATSNSSGCNWTTSGDGAFDNAASLTAVYTPGPNDISSGTVDLTLTCHATVPCAVDDDDTMTVTINPLPDDSLAVGAAVAAVCSGSGTNVTVDLSEVGVNYQLRNDAGNVDVGAAVPGDGGTINLPTGPIAAATTFNVLATNATTNCSTQLVAKQTITLLAGTEIQTHPSNANAVLNPPAPAPSAVFSVIATGTNLTFQWQQSTDGGTSFSNVTTGTGATTATYTTAPVAVSDSGKKFRCVVTGDCGVKNSNAANLAVQDASGVSNATEDAGPNNGDGNSDGIPDSQQANVTSLPNENGVYVTLETPDGTQLAGVVSGGNPSPGDAPAGVQFPAGFQSFMVTGVAPGGSTTVKIFLPVGVSVNTYYKYGIEPGNGTPHWYEFNFDGTTGAEINGNVITLHFVDGQRGDKDLTANGIIDDPGAPASKEGGAGQNTPTNPLCFNFFLSFLFRLPICGLGCGMAIIATFAGLVGMKFSRRRRVLRKR